MSGGPEPKVGSFKVFQSGAAGVLAHHEEPWNWMEGGQAAIETSRYNEWCPEPTGTATWALIWSDGWDIKKGRARIRRDVPPVPVVNQETNGGEPEQMLTTCLVNSVTLRRRNRKKKERYKNRKSTFKQTKKKILPQSNTFLADWQKVVGKVWSDLWAKWAVYW